jgi:hypothetical protein
MGDMTHIEHPIQLVETHGEPTVRDVDLGTRLGMKRPTNIRRVIERNKGEIEGYGLVHAVSAPYESGKGRTEIATEYHLTEEQALCLCQLSRAPKAKDVRRMLIEVFTRYRRGHLVPELTPQSVGGIMKGVVRKALAEAVGELVPAMLEAAIEKDPRIAAVDNIPALEVVVQRGVIAKGRRRVVQVVSNRLVRFCETHGYSVTRDLSGRRLFPRAAVRHWLADGGWASISDLVDQLKGQGRLRLV